MSRPGIRQALLKPAFAHLYPGIPANEWQSAAAMMAQVLALQPGKRSGGQAGRRANGRVLEEAHFDFRGVASAGASDAAREAKQAERQRRQAAE
jgi:hypothetical protein